MYLHRIRAENFRVFGDGTKSPSLDWVLNPGLNILVGENDAGKTAIIDAIRQILWTTSFETVRLGEDDFHVSSDGRSTMLAIEATLVGLSEDQEAAALEWLTYEEGGSRSLVLHLQAKWVPPASRRRGRVEWSIRSGKDGIGSEVGSAVREMVRSTYLRPLRDAEAEMQPRRGSRLSQILAAHRDIDGQERNDFNAANAAQVPTTLVGMMALAQHYIGNHAVIRGVESDINQDFLEKIAFVGDRLAAKIRLASDLSLGPILEKFELKLLPPGSIEPNARCNRGLGYNNVLFMATELVLLREGEDLALLLIEEPEAHLHPQLQERVLALLTASAQAGVSPVQVVVTTHSPSLAATADVAAMTLVVGGETYRLDQKSTLLEPADYAYLRRFLEATRANLFFARGVMIVEGPGEGILLPALAKQCGRSFSERGISVVNVGDVGLYHYSRILQRRSEDERLRIPVACVTDRDVVPDGAEFVSRPRNRKRFFGDYGTGEIEDLVQKKKARAEGGAVKVFVSDSWTLEFDLALSGCAKLMFLAVQLAVADKSSRSGLTAAERDAAIEHLNEEWPAYSNGLGQEALALKIYQPLYKKDGSKAVAAQFAAHLLGTGAFGEGEALLQVLPAYLRDAIVHLTGPLGEAQPQPAERDAVGA
jgi:putative ATP-dependent endonuclease of OLD family